jgi:hypothetical protein
LDRIIVATLDNNNNNTNSRNNNSENDNILNENNIVDQISLGWKVNNFSNNNDNADNSDRILEEELRSTILRLSLLDVSMKKLSDDCTWTLMLVTNEHNDKNQSNILQEILVSGEYMIDNNLLPENIAKNKMNNSNRYDINDNYGNDNSQEQTNIKNPKINSIKSFQNSYFNLNVSFMNLYI